MSSRCKDISKAEIDILVKQESHLVVRPSGVDVKR
jgi:hypothetical protein